MNIGDKITNQRHGVNATNIPVGATVRYDVFTSANGVSGPTWTMEVRMLGDKKVLGFPNIPFGRPGYPDQFVHGQNGSMTILTLP